MMNMEHLETIEYRGYKITVDYDEFGDSPREWDNVGVIYDALRNYRFDGHSIDEWNEMESHEDYIYMPFYAYIHGGITISTGSFNDPWDSGCAGVIAIERDRAIEEWGEDYEDKAIACMEGEIKTMDMFLTGDVYTLSIVDPDGCCIDSCSGWYGNDGKEEGIIEEKHVIDFEISKICKKGCEELAVPQIIEDTIPYLCL